MTFRQEQDMGRDFYHSTALFEVVKSFSTLKEHGKVPYQKPQLKSMAHGTCTCTHI